MTSIGVILCGESICACLNPENASLTLIQGKIRLLKRKVSFSHFATNTKKILFASKTQFSLNQGQGSVFKVWECALSIPSKNYPHGAIFRKINYRLLKKQKSTLFCVYIEAWASCSFFMSKQGRGQYLAIGVEFPKIEKIPKNYKGPLCKRIFAPSAQQGSSP
jgi:hypothetical protein